MGYRAADASTARPDDPHLPRPTPTSRRGHASGAWCIPTSPAATIEQLRADTRADRLLLLAEVGGRVVGSGVADRSHITGGSSRRGSCPSIDGGASGRPSSASSSTISIARGFHVGHAPMSRTRAPSRSRPTTASRRSTARSSRSARVDARRASPRHRIHGVEFATVAAEPELLQRSFALAQQGYADMALKTGPAVVPIDEWLREEATLPAGTFVALEHGIIVGYAGLLAWTDDPTRAENGLTVVDRRWRGRGLGTALKRRQLAWAAANGIRELVTWTQEGNEAMQRVNVSLGYTPRSISRTMRRDLP